MPRTLRNLTAAHVNRIRDDRTGKYTGMHSDGGGLYLQVTPSGASWLYCFMLNGRSREMGLGPLHSVGLADARRKAEGARRLRAEGIDPIEARKAERAKIALEAARAITFKDAAEKFIEAHRAGWRNAKHADQWSSTLETYVYPMLGSLSVQDIDVPLVLKVLEPIWKTKTETASRVRGRIEAVLDWATVRGYRRGDNPARWRGLLENVLPQRSKVQRVAHHAALPYAEIGAFVAALRKQEGISALALEFTILTAARTGEVIGAKWGEFDLVEKTWTIPAERMKGGREHRVPLSVRALEILAEMKPLAQVALGQDETEAFVFPGGKPGKPLSNMAMLKLLERMGRDDLTAHGFRSTFRDWAAERTSYPREVAEMALAHSIGDKVEAAYRRGDLFEKRRRLMNEWAKFCSTVPSGNVATIARLHPAAS
jgi:integrase